MTTCKGSIKLLDGTIIPCPVSIPLPHINDQCCFHQRIDDICDYRCSNYYCDAKLCFIPAIHEVHLNEDDEKDGYFMGYNLCDFHYWHFIKMANKWLDDSFPENMIPTILYEQLGLRGGD